MENLREQALAKMLEEMNKEHTQAEDRIHNWLCDQSEEALFENILKPGKTIAGAFNYAKNKARREATNNVAVIEDQTVYDWVVEYFANEKEEPIPTTVPTRKLGVEEEKMARKREQERVKKEAEKARKAELKKAGAVEGQTSIFEMLADERPIEEELPF